ncbi:MAG: hypothetical protein ACI9QC_000382 [Oceanicoccus sp.]|jgi:hypothetical protein
MGPIGQGLLGMGLGFLIIVFRKQIKDMTGNIGFAERYLGRGGTWTFLALLGFAVFVLSLMWATGTIQDFAVNNLGSFI